MKYLRMESINQVITWADISMFMESVNQLITWGIFLWSMKSINQLITWDDIPMVIGVYG